MIKDDSNTRKKNVRPTLTVDVEINDGRVESLVKRIADKKGGKDGRVAKSETGRGIYTESAQIKLRRT